MKKLLLLTVLALGVIACDKNELGDMDSSSITPIEVKVDDSFARNAVLDVIFGGIADAAPVFKGNSSVSTAKGSDYIAAYLFTDDSKSYMVLVDDDNDDLCFGELSVNAIYMNNSDGNGLATIEDSSEMVTKTLGSGYAHLFEATLNEVILLDFSDGADLIADQAYFNDDNIAEFGS